MSTTSATVASSVPKLDPSVARNSRAKAGRGGEEAQLPAEAGHPGEVCQESCCSRPQPGECLRKERVILSRPDRHANRLRGAEARERTHDHAFA